jgi:hypothetical protein
MSGTGSKFCATSGNWLRFKGCMPSSEVTLLSVVAKTGIEKLTAYSKVAAAQLNNFTD